MQNVALVTGASDRASYVIGQMLAVDGGFEATGIGLPAMRAEGGNGSAAH
jgi:hypothetical protein